MPDAAKIAACARGTERDRRNQIRVNVLGLAWMACWLGVLFAVKGGWIPAGPAGAASGLLPALLGLGTMAAYARYLRATDELRRKVELEALALAVGVGLVGGTTYTVIEVSGMVEESGFTVVVALMMVTYALGVLLGHRRYS